jgi:hypothetical protein
MVNTRLAPDFSGAEWLEPTTPRIGFPGSCPRFSGVEALRAGLRDLGYISTGPQASIQLQMAS